MSIDFAAGTFVGIWATIGAYWLGKLSARRARGPR